MHYKLAYINVEDRTFEVQDGWRIHTILEHLGNFATGVQLYVLLEKPNLPSVKSKADDMKEALDSFENGPFSRYPK